MSQETDAALADGARYACGAAPILDFAPRGCILVKLARHHMEIDAGARESVRDLRYAAYRTVRQPLRGIRGFIIERGGGLQIQHQHRRPRPLHHWQHLRRRGVGGHVAQYQAHILAQEAPAGIDRTLRRVYQTRGNNLAAKPADPLFHRALVSIQPLLHAGKLRPVGR